MKPQSLPFGTRVRIVTGWGNWGLGTVVPSRYDDDVEGGQRVQADWSKHGSHWFGYASLELANGLDEILERA